MVLYNPRLVESTNAEPQIWKNRGYGELTVKLYSDFNCARGQCPYPMLYKAQQYKILEIIT